MIINLTADLATAEQIAEDVVDLPSSERRHLLELLEIDDSATDQQIKDCCHDIALLAVHNGLGPDDDSDPHPLHALIDIASPRITKELQGALLDQGVATLTSLAQFS